MNQFAVNLSTIFTEVPFMERFKKARECGFSYVECQFPYEYCINEIEKELGRNHLNMVLLNLPPGNWQMGDRGLAVDPSRIDEFRQSVETAIQYAKAFNVSKVHCMAGIASNIEPDLARETFIKNIHYAATHVGKHNITLLIEPINSFDIPGYFLNNLHLAVEIIKEINLPNVKLQFDFYHIQRIHGNSLSLFNKYADVIRHVQVADVPGRHEPGTGEMNYRTIFDHLRASYEGNIGLEYFPLTKSEDSFGWLTQNHWRGNEMKIGFIGTGVMGSRMVKRLLDHGNNVYVYTRTKEKARPLQEIGAGYLESIPKLAAECDIICTCLSMPADVIEVYGGSKGILENARHCTICVDFTTVGPETSKLIFEQATKVGISYLDAPVSGGPEGVANGTLTIMVGGEEHGFERVLPILKVIGGTIEFLGPAGSGSIAKLINQYLVAVHSLAASEAMVAGAAYGLDSEQLLNLLKVSYGDSKILRRHMEEYVLDRQFEPGGAVKYVHKDVRLANQLFEEAGMGEFTGQLAQHAFQQAEEKGLQDLDMSAVILPLENACDVVVKKKVHTIKQS